MTISEVQKDFAMVGRNVYGKVDGNILLLAVDVNAKPLKVTNKGNKTIATVGGGVFMGKGKINFTYYEIGA
jgi:hypothetical protein